MKTDKPYFKYWGKTDRNDPEKYHLLPYHCLDVAAVAWVWWEQSPVIRKAFCRANGMAAREIKAWTHFFIALHDIGKFDLRFQRKAIEAWRLLMKPTLSTNLNEAESRNYLHGPAGLYWVHTELDKILGTNNQGESEDQETSFDFLWDNETQEEDKRWSAWKPWIEAVAGHHGHVVSTENNSTFPIPRDCPSAYKEHDALARKTWVYALESLFLNPAGLSIIDLPPKPPTTNFIAGFCSVADWLGSANSEKHFEKVVAPSDLMDYFKSRHEDAREVLQVAGLVGKVKSYQGVQNILKEGQKPHQVQTLIDDLPPSKGISIIEAPTGSGKTEAALAYAWQLVSHGLAESITFALPTQATANAMLNRLETVAIKLFESHPNLLLAHGNARFNKAFSTLRGNSGSESLNDEDAWAQCSEWLAQSRKRAFLGQIGVCTIDQVLTSVLPVRHNFIRSFGLGRNILIIDEVHAYDTYMYTLLKAVLKEQKAAGGSVLLLSATLPDCQKNALLETWNINAASVFTAEQAPYPLITQVSDSSREEYQLAAEQMLSDRNIWIDSAITEECIPTQEIIQQAINAANSGAKVALICNLVDVAQQAFQAIRKVSTFPVFLFHSRFTLEDRQQIEKEILTRFGATASHSGGCVLIATQVVEQSLDIDFDWMVTQLCPVDLLFQRLGRLHRHPHKDTYRPAGCRSPRCTVLLPNGLDYGLHELIYANTRVMWRTAEKIDQLKGCPLIFPKAYRNWVEDVYQETAWGNEPEEVEKRYMDFMDHHETVQKFSAQLMLNSVKNMTPLMDDDQRISAVTRDGPMSLTVVPCVTTPSGRRLRDGRCLEKMNEVDKPEAISMNKVSVPNTWISILDKFCETEDGIYWLNMEADADDWHVRLGPWELTYNKQTGMERIK